MFQQAKDRILQGIEDVICYIDDIFVTGSIDKQNLEKLREVLKRLKEYALRVKKNKCDFFQCQVIWVIKPMQTDGTCH